MLHRIMITAILASVTLVACATDQNLGNDNTPITQIRSTQDLEAYLQTTPDSPLNHLSADAKQRFVGSLVFTERGLASFRYSELKTLPATDIRQILSLFGVEHTISLFTTEPAVSNVEEIMDYTDKWCSSRATCSSQIGSICTSNC